MQELYNHNSQGIWYSSNDVLVKPSECCHLGIVALRNKCLQVGRKIQVLVTGGTIGMLPDHWAAAQKGQEVKEDKYG